MIFNKIISAGFRFNLMQLATRSFSSVQNLVKLPTQMSSSVLQFSPIAPLQAPVQNSFLKPNTYLFTQIAGFKVKGRLKLRCKDCFFVMRQQRLFVLCKAHPRHKQMAMKKKEKNTWLLTHATQSKIRPY